MVTYNKTFGTFRMARIRTIKPEFWTSEQIVECSTNARLLFVGLWNFCDDGGVHPASVRRIKMEVFPGDAFSHEQIQDWISELLDVGLLDLFDYDGDGYWFVNGWHHQKIDRPSLRYPGPLNNKKLVDLSTSHRRVIDESSTSHRRRPPPGRESKGRERKEPPPNPPLGGTSIKQTSKPKSYSEAFLAFWALYPARKGRKLDKGKAFAEFEKIDPERVQSLMRATENLARSDQLPKDAHRWLRTNKSTGQAPWEDWVKEAQNDDVTREVAPPGRYDHLPTVGKGNDSSTT